MRIFGCQNLIETKEWRYDGCGFEAGRVQPQLSACDLQMCRVAVADPEPGNNYFISFWESTVQ
jgi:hypothetical protein